MKNSALPKLALLTLLISACSVVVNADRSKVPDDLYQPSVIPDAGTTEDAGDNGGAAGAAGAAEAAGASGASAEAGAAGTTAAAGAAGS